MLLYEEVEAAETPFQRFDWRLQVVFIAWSIGVVVLMLGIRLLTANATLLSIVR